MYCVRRIQSSTPNATSSTNKIEAHNEQAMYTIQGIEGETKARNTFIFKGFNSSSISSSWVQSPDPLSTVKDLQSMAEKQRSTLGRTVNLTCLRAFDRVRLAAESLATYLMEALTENPRPHLYNSEYDIDEDDCGLKIDPECFKYIVSNRYSSFSSQNEWKKWFEYYTPVYSTLDSVKTNDVARRRPASAKSESSEEYPDPDADEFDEYRNPYRWIENDRIWISIMKESRGFELEVYKNEIIRHSPFIPEYRNHSVISEQYILLELEAVFPLSEYKETAFTTAANEPAVLVMSRILLDGMGALRDIHKAGYVHSDVSSNNIGFNRRTGLWQVFDFNQSLPIEQSLSKKRRGGTRGFRSKDFEVFGVARPLDDYISLVKTIQSKWKNTFQEIFGSIFKTIKQSDDTVNADNWYREAFNIFCKLFKDSKLDKELEMDPSYLVASIQIEAITKTRMV